MAKVTTIEAQKLIGKYQIPLQILPKNKSFTDAFKRIMSFQNDNIIVTRVKKYPYGDTKSVEVQYVSEKDTYVNTIIVPGDFVFKVPTAKNAQAIIKKYRKFLEDYLYTTVDYLDGEVGSDPEIFAEDETGKIIPAFEFLGSKESPTVYTDPKFHGEFNGGYPSNHCYWDGFQAEFTTTPKECMGWHSDSIQNGLKGVHKALKKYNPKAKLSAKTVFEISEKMLKEAKPEHVAFGCAPSFNIYKMKGKRLNGDQVTIRPAGGHIHFGCGKLDAKTLENVVQALDAVLGVACVSMFGKLDDKRRRELYGLAGEYRLPPHGLEYRTLSNAWLFHPLLANLVFDLARGAFALGKSDLLKYWEGDPGETIECINTNNIEMARSILKRNEKMFKAVLNVTYGEDIKSTWGQRKAEYARKFFMEGAESFIKNIDDIAGNWNLDGDWVQHCNGRGKNLVYTIQDYPGKKIVAEIKKV